MSVPVDLDALRDRLGEYGTSAFLVTVNEDGSPHVVSVTARYDDGRLVVGAGRTTRANATRSPALTLLWPPVIDPAYSMIVDGVVAPGDSGAGGDDDLVIDPRWAVLHRIAGAPGDGPTCLALGET